MAEEKTPVERATEPPTPFHVLVPKIADGHVNEVASDALRDLVAAMRDDAIARGATSKGKLTLTLDLTLKGGVFDINAEVKTKAPKVTFARTVMYATDSNSLVAEDPKQERFPFQNVRRLDQAVEVKKV